MNKNLLLIAALMTLCGCKNLNSVITCTQTGLGVSVSENPSTQLYEARFGYFRNEFAFVPGNTNYPGTVPDVLMEIRMENILKGGLVYQRLAVGANAVTQPGANTAAALMKVPSPSAEATAGKLPLAQTYQKASDKAPFDAVAKNLGYASFATFLTNSTLTPADVVKMKDALKAANLIQ
jgi:hypothetical protein